ncbi:hypothetical protein H2200_000897 [Cladophialophora chaetospira]|uniref:Uncharacterized protein n=1 Tax=Cladophialophora chaetospira TaxID=386627 RepID=A0AA38XPP3_9EURO|nr:hypothetical protein H2200_000897 [Cladophialophora chaetospira]
MPSPPSIFIEYAAEGRSARDKELLDSKARAHAARWANQKAPPQRRSPQGAKADTVRVSPKDRAVVAAPDRSGHRQFLPQSAVSEPAKRRKRRPNLPEQALSTQGSWRFVQEMLGRGVSPLQSYPVQIDSNRIRSIEYFPQLWSRWAADVIPNRTEREAATNMAVTNIVQRCLTDELHMIAFISYVLQRAPAANVSKVFLLQTAGKALSELRSRIESGNASIEEVVWPIIFLAHYELFGSQSVWAGRAHLKAVVDLGGMEYLDEVTKVYIRRMDRGWWSDYPSIFPPLLSPTPRWEKMVTEISDDDFAGSGFVDHAEILGSDLTDTLPFVVDCVRAGVLCKDRVLLGSENEALQYRVIRTSQALMDTLRAMLPAEPVRMACIYPAMIWLQYMTWVMRDLATKASSSVDSYRNVARQAQPNLLRCVEQSSQAHEMLLWAAVVGIVTSRDEATRIRYATRGLNLARNVDVVDLRDSWRRYIWLDVCAIIDYGMICDAFDEAVKQDPLLATQQWERTRRALLSEHRYVARASPEISP